MMNEHAYAHRLAVCTWSLKPKGPADLIRMLYDLQIQNIQLALGPVVYEKAWANAGKQLASAGISVVSGMFGTQGEDYASLKTIKATGGVVPDHTWDHNWKHIGKIIAAAASLGITLVSFHAGFLPESLEDRSYAKMSARLKKIAEAFAGAGMDLAFETGQEEAETLKQFLEDLGAPNVGVNFDPANMILYGKGDPVEAIKILGPFIRQVHIKDAIPSLSPGEWGQEKPAGTGAVDWPGFFSALDDAEFSGFFCIEREAGVDRIQDIRAAKQMVLRYDKADQDEK